MVNPPTASVLAPEPLSRADSQISSSASLPHAPSHHSTPPAARITRWQIHWAGRGPRVDIVGDFEMRKYKRGEDSSNGSLSDDGKGIMKTDISVGYSMEPRADDRSQEGRVASVDSLV